MTALKTETETFLARVQALASQPSPATPPRLGAFEKALIAAIAAAVKDALREQNARTDREWFTVAEVAALVGNSPRTVYEWINAGMLIANRDRTGKIRIRRSEIEAFLSGEVSKRVRGGAR